MNILGKDQDSPIFFYFSSDVNHHASLVRCSLHKYKCLWSVGGGKDRDSSLQERASYTYTLYLKKKKKTQNFLKTYIDCKKLNKLLCLKSSESCTFSPKNK